MKPAEVGARLGGRDGDVLLARQPADLDERARDQLGQLRRRVGRAHQRRADEDRVGAGELGGGALGARLDRRLSAITTRSRGAPRDELELRVAVDRERREVARVDPDHRRAERDRRARARRRRAPRRACRGRARRVAHQRGAGASSRSRRISSAASAPASRAVRRCSSVEKKPLASSGSVGRRARGAQVVQRAAEALVDEHRHRRCAGACELRGELRRVGVGPQVAGRRRAPLDLGDRAEAAGRRRECVARPRRLIGHVRSGEGDQRVEPFGGGARVERFAREREPLAQVVGVPGRGDRAGSVEQDRRRARRPSLAREDRADRGGVLVGGAAAQLVGIAALDAEVERVDLALAHVAVDDLADEVRARRGRARRSRPRRGRRTRAARRAARAPRRSPARAAASRRRRSARARPPGSSAARAR